VRDARRRTHSGVVIAPQLYVAAAVSTAIQQVAGMPDADTIVASNTDLDALSMHLQASL
jgi:electron transfer flavoprotein alpha subunit